MVQHDVLKWIHYTSIDTDLVLFVYYPYSMRQQQQKYRGCTYVLKKNRFIPGEEVNQTL